MLDNLFHVKRLHKKYDIPMEDIFLMGINLSGINTNIPDKRMVIGTEMVVIKINP